MKSTLKNLALLFVTLNVIAACGNPETRRDEEAAPTIRQDTARINEGMDTLGRDSVMTTPMPPM